MPKNIAQGAEAVLRKDEWDGLDSLVKDRIEKSYRVEQLDEKLRKSRTKQEGKLLSEARRSGVPTPQIYEIKETVLTMEYLDGEKVRDMVPEIDAERRKQLAEEIGEKIGRLHERGIIHGDLTTSNLIFCDDEVYFIDFGLGYFSDSIEDKAVDLHLIWEVLISTHSRYSEEMWQAIVDGYKNYKEAEKVLKRVKQIKKRGRYVDR
ncbi:MAG: KEOPS complex kinase/ATPase Bud32 [Candidatus Aenigmatarchaeota archaeon]